MRERVEEVVVEEVGRAGLLMAVEVQEVVEAVEVAVRVVLKVDLGELAIA